MHSRDRDWLAKYLPERRNVVVALALASASASASASACSEGDPEVLARLVAALAQLDALAQMPAEVVRVAVPMDRVACASPALRARAQLELGWAHFLDGHRDQGTDLTLRALADFEVLDDQVGSYSAMTRLGRLYIGRPGMEERAQDIWVRLKRIDETGIPLRLRLTCEITLTPEFEGGRSVQRLQELLRIAQQSGFEYLAGVCRMRITDELLRQGRNGEVVSVADGTLQSDEPNLRNRAVIHHNRAHALVRLGRHAEAQVAARVVLRAMPGYAFLVMDLFALVAAQTGQHEQAALLLGCSAQVKRERDVQDEGPELALIKETLALLKRELGESRVAALMHQGMAMAVADVLPVAWRPDGATAHTATR